MQQQNIGRIVGANRFTGHVATLASKTPYSITYAEKQLGRPAFGLRAAYVGNASGNFTYPRFSCNISVPR